MAGELKTFSALGAIASVADDDIVPLWDTSAAVTGRATRAQVIGATITGGGTLATGGKSVSFPADGTAAILEAAQTYTAKPTFAVGVAGGSQANVLDDAAFSITAPANYGIMLIMVANLNTGAGAVYFRAQTGSAGQCALIASGPSTILATTVDTVLTGATGVDGKITISANQTDGKIYIENRSAGTRNFAWLFVTA